MGKLYGALTVFQACSKPFTLFTDSPYTSRESGMCCPYLSYKTIIWA